MIDGLKARAPFILSVTATNDMGFEFSAVVPGGIIFPSIGMLLDYSSGNWPLLEWEGKEKDEQEELTKKLLLSKVWDVTPWQNLDEQDIIEAFEILSGREA